MVAKNKEDCKLFDVSIIRHRFIVVSMQTTRFSSFAEAKIVRSGTYHNPVATVVASATTTVAGE